MSRSDRSPAGTLNVIYQVIVGWDTIDNLSDGVVGNDTETASAFALSAWRNLSALTRSVPFRRCWARSSASPASSTPM